MNDHVYSSCLNDEVFPNINEKKLKHLIERRKRIQHQLKNNLNRQILDTIYIPVVFHNIYKISDGIPINSYCDYGNEMIENSQAICNERMHRSLEVLNAQYKPSAIQFIVHPDYQNMQHATDPGFDGFLDNATGGTNTTPNAIRGHYNIPNAINIYTHSCLGSSTNSCMESKYGYSTYPWTLDNNFPGIFIRHKSLPGSEEVYMPAKKQQVGILAHEMSHYFSLLHINGTWFTQKGNIPRELVNGDNCNLFGDLICDTPASPGLIPYISDTLFSYYLNSINRECIYHGYGGNYDINTGILKIGGYNTSFKQASLPNYNYCNEWGFSDPFGLDNCETFTNYDINGDFFGTNNLPHECINQDKSSIYSECPLTQYSNLPLGDNFMQAGTQTFEGCYHRPIGHTDYDINQKGFTEEQFANIRFSLEYDYTGCNDPNACNYDITSKHLLRFDINNCLYPCNDEDDCNNTCDIHELKIKYSNVIEQFKLNTIYPNPFNTNCKINYIINQSSNINISIYDINGNLIIDLIDSFQNKGKYSILWNASNISSGIYFIKMQSFDKIISKKIILLK